MSLCGLYRPKLQSLKPLPTAQSSDQNDWLNFFSIFVFLQKKTRILYFLSTYQYLYGRLHFSVTTVIVDFPIAEENAKDMSNVIFESYVSKYSPRFIIAFFRNRLNLRKPCSYCRIELDGHDARATYLSGMMLHIHI